MIPRFPKFRHPSFSALLAALAVAETGCATVERAREAQRDDAERTLSWAETPFAGREDALSMHELAEWARTNAPAVVQARQDVVQARRLRSIINVRESVRVGRMPCLVVCPPIRCRLHMAVRRC